MSWKLWVTMKVSCNICKYTLSPLSKNVYWYFDLNIFPISKNEYIQKPRSCLYSSASEQGSSYFLFSIFKYQPAQSRGVFYVLSRECSRPKHYELATLYLLYTTLSGFKWCKLRDKGSLRDVSVAYASSRWTGIIMPLQIGTLGKILISPDLVCMNVPVWACCMDLLSC